MKVEILHPTNHDGQDLAAGEVANLPEDAAAALIACGSAQPARAEGDGQKRATAKPEKD